MPFGIPNRFRPIPEKSDSLGGSDGMRRDAIQEMSILGQLLPRRYAPYPTTRRSVYRFESTSVSSASGIGPAHSYASRTKFVTTASGMREGAD